MGLPCGVLGVEEMAWVGRGEAMSRAAESCREVAVMRVGRGVVDCCFMLPKSDRVGRGGRCGCELSWAAGNWQKIGEQKGM